LSIGKNSRRDRWLAPLTAILSLVAYYGTLLAMAGLGALGVSLALNDAIWAGVIVVFVWLSLPGLWLRRRRHGLLWPIMLAAVGATMITFAMLVTYVRLIELAGFASLCFVSAPIATGEVEIGCSRNVSRTRERRR
jgi:hypothetical protein